MHPIHHVLLRNVGKSMRGTVNDDGKIAGIRFVDGVHGCFPDAVELFFGHRINASHPFVSGL